MKNATREDLTRALTEFHHSAATLQSLVGELEPRGRMNIAKWLPSLPATLLSIVALALALYVAANAVAPAAAAKPEPQNTESLASARMFALFPDGRVELSDPWSGTRVFQWDGTKWRLVDPASTTPPPRAEAPKRAPTAVAAERPAAGATR
jgi:hypothetical protein